MSKISDALFIRGNRIKNRIVMAPMYLLSFKGRSAPFYGSQHIEHYTQRAKGGAGLIIVQATEVSGAANGTNLWSDDNSKVLKQLAANCHTYGAAVLMQLSCGNDDINLLSTDEIDSIQLNMKAAAISACEMGFDGVEYHFAHGYTLCRFLDANFNRRNDRYGGDTANRTRVLTELLPDIRINTHEKFMVGVRMGEYLPESQDGIEAAKIFEKAGVDLLNISFGMNSPEYTVPESFRCSPVTYCGCKIKKEVNIPVIAVNEIKTREQILFLIENDYVDLVAIGRGMLADPEFANHILQNEPLNNCRGCGNDLRNCFWFADHTKCPAMKSQ
jgi:2,4-dienoyl-CoA reductase-like NADH-dependent reductase (Old Yellow Enzyme family)